MVDREPVLDLSKVPVINFERQVEIRLRFMAEQVLQHPVEIWRKEQGRVCVGIGKEAFVAVLLIPTQLFKDSTMSHAVADMIESKDSRSIHAWIRRKLPGATQEK